jgi:hypothetical protein
VSVDEDAGDRAGEQPRQRAAAATAPTRRGSAERDAASRGKAASRMPSPRLTSTAAVQKVQNGRPSVTGGG